MTRVGASLGRSGASFSLAAVLVLLGGSARAQTDEQRAGARAAANAGGAAFMDKKYADAIDMFTRAESLVHSPVHLLYMARSYEKLGQLVKARETYIRITNEDAPAGASQPIKQARADAEKEQEALEPRIPYVSVVVQGGGSSPVTVTMDGVQVPPALVGVPRPVDPGDHKFEAAAQGMDSAVSSIAVREGHSETVVLTLHAAASQPPPGQMPVGYAPVGYGQPQQPQQPPPAADSGGGHGPSPLTWVAFGVGAVGLGVGTIFALQASSKASDVNAQQCSLLGPDGKADWCPSSTGSQIDDVRTDKTISLVGFIAGGIGVAAGVTLLLVTPKKAPAQASVETYLGLGAAGVRGRF
ncbi:MAG TPA: hypothetical protein VHE30_28400 [Polyangiaceae bacterium]|nr:hypothetical protein [Polyangiaceae bacterium]